MLKVPIISAPPPLSSPVKGEEVRACSTAFSPPFKKGGLGLPAIARLRRAQARRTGWILKQEGYTLVEVLVALGILGFGLLAVATMQVTAIKTNARASNLSHGTTLAQAKAEELMNLSYSTLVDYDRLGDLDGTDQDTNDDGIDDDGDNFGLDDTVDGGGIQTADGWDPNVNGGYDIFWNVAVNEPTANSARVRVIVTWTEREKNKRVSLDFVQTNLS